MEHRKRPGRHSCALLTERRATVRRKTKETDIEVKVNLDATGPIKVVTGIGFFDHMLEQIAKHGGFALDLDCKGDLEIDEHHTVEDCALAVGEALRTALGAKLGIARYGFVLPMTRRRYAWPSICSGRAYGVFEGKFTREAVGGLPTELVPHFFKSLAESLKAAVHVTITGENTHHLIEACFKVWAARCARRSGARVKSCRRPKGMFVSVVIIDSGGANIASLQAALRRLGADSVVTTDHAAIRQATRVLLPGVGFRARRHGAAAACRPGPADPDAQTTLVRHLPRHAAAVRTLRGRPGELPGRDPGLHRQAAVRTRAPGAAHGLEPDDAGAPGSAARRHQQPRLRVLRAQLRRADVERHRGHHRLRQALHRGRAHENFCGTQFHPSARAWWARASSRIS
jgi:imidazoleglycerol phosphate dehydratase HisB